MKLKQFKSISVILTVLLSLTSVVPAAQASELDNALVEPAPSQYYLSGLWLVLIYPEYIDIHLWYQLSDTTAHYVHTDHLTGSNVITDENGELEELLDYFPYGNVRINDQTGSYNELIQYAGSRFDEDTGLNYLGARYYSSGLGRFISQDPAFWAVGTSELNEILARANREKFSEGYYKDRKTRERTELQEFLANPQQLNSYSYAVNNPLKYTDPEGEFAMLALVIPVAEYAIPVIIAGAAAIIAITVDYFAKDRPITWNPGDFQLPSIHNPQTPDETNLFPNGQPNLPPWKKIILGSALTSAAVKEFIEPIKGFINNLTDSSSTEVENKPTPVKHDSQQSKVSYPKNFIGPLPPSK